jgi:hypothetical protein
VIYDTGSTAPSPLAVAQADRAHLRHPLLGSVDGIGGLYLSTGGGGHCFKLGPAFGEMIAGEILGSPVEYADIGRFALSRFERGAPFGSSFGGNRA